MVGVILLSEEHHWMGASMVKGNRRAISLFNMTESGKTFLELVMESIAHRVNIASDADRNFAWLKEYAASQAGDLVITPPRHLSVDDPEASMALLFGQLTRHERT